MLGFIKIQGGKFIMSYSINETKTEKINYQQVSYELKPFYLSKYPVTVAQYKVYLKETGKTELESFYQYNRFGNHPVAYVNRNEAIDYCNWLTDQFRKSNNLPQAFQEIFHTNNYTIRLPSEVEWEKAARGEEGRNYPWGDQFDKDRLNYEKTKIDRPSPVGCFNKGASIDQVMEMSGNVWEWTLRIDEIEPDKYHNSFEQSEKKCTTKGGGWNSNAEDCLTDSRLMQLPSYGIEDTSFRLCFAPKPPTPESIKILSGS